MTRLLGQTFRCRDCQQEWPRTRAGQLYCTSCTPSTPSERRKMVLRDVGIDRNRSMARGVYWRADLLPELLWHERFSVAFDAKVHSKNASHVLTKGSAKRRIPTKGNAHARAEIAEQAKLVLAGNGIRPVQARVWIDLLLRKFAWQADAANVVDVVLDGLKLGIGLDDRWFSIRALDWELSKDEQTIVIGIGQDTEVDHDFCGACGALVPFLSLVRYASMERVCEGCKDETERRILVGP